MSVRVVDPGLQSSVQDLGRSGYAHLGVPAGGAADVLSLVIGNRILGNPDGAAVIETPMRPCLVTFDEEAVVCITGVAPRAEIVEGTRQRRIEPFCATPVPKGASIRFAPGERSMRASLCIAGGIETPMVLGSRSAYPAAPLGPYAGALRAGDVLPVGRISSSPRPTPTQLVNARLIVGEPQVLRVITPPGGAVGSLLRESFRVLPQSNRMGVRLHAAIPPGSGERRMITEAMWCGAIQMPSDAEPIILGVDHPTTGGYPVAASVIAADLPHLGQLAPGAHVRFEEVSLDTALAIFKRARAALDELLPPVTGASRTIDLNCDLGEGMPPEHDAAMMRSVSSVSIACGGHAGDEASMRRSVLATMKHGCRIGAHPSYPDRANFGRAPMMMATSELEGALVEQVTALTRIASSCGAEVAYVKPHGALYNAAMTDFALADCVARAVARCGHDIAIMGLAGSPAVERWRAAGYRVITEAFADRRYEPDGRLRARTQADALITDPREASRQAVQFAEERRADTLCIHADTPGAAEIAAEVRATLTAAGWRVCPVDSAAEA